MTPSVNAIPGIIVTPNPIRPETADNGRQGRVQERQAERRAARPDFAPSPDNAAPAAKSPPPGAGNDARAEVGELGGAPQARRRTDTGTPGEAPPGLEIPPHLERRRAWREAKGLDTFHAQKLAQAVELPPDSETRKAATLAYRSQGQAMSGRGSLDIDLAQRLSLTV